LLTFLVALNGTSLALKQCVGRPGQRQAMNLSGGLANLISRAIIYEAKGNSIAEKVRHRYEFMGLEQRVCFCRRRRGFLRSLGSVSTGM
jgi:hypothetical protein